MTMPRGFDHVTWAVLRLLALWVMSTGAWAVDPQAITLTDDRGVTVRWAEPPVRIVSLLPSLTESVCALGGCDRLVGTDRHSNWPSSVATLPKLGGLDDTAIEAIVALRPGVVLAAPSSRAIARLEALGLKVAAFDSDRHEQVHASLERIARLLGEPARARDVWRSIESDLERAAAQVPAAWRGRTVYFETDSAPYAAGVSSFIGQTLATMGLLNIVPAALGPFPRLNPEFVVRAQPDLILGVRHVVESMPRRPGWRGLPALQRGQVCAFDASVHERLIRPGPRLGEAAQDLAQCLAALPSPGKAQASGTVGAWGPLRPGDR